MQLLAQWKIVTVCFYLFNTVLWDLRTYDLTSMTAQCKSFLYLRFQIKVRLALLEPMIVEPMISEAVHAVTSWSYLTIHSLWDIGLYI